MKNKLRILLPRGEVLIAVMVMYLLCEGTLLLYEWQLGQRSSIFPRPGVVIFQFSCLAYGGFRIRQFHPYYRADYRRWLETTPWTRAKPLPVGPIHLVWQDLVVMGAIGALASQQVGLNPLELLPIYLFGYLVALGFTLFSTGARPFGYAVFFGLGLAIRLWHTMPACAVAAMLAYLVGAFGLRRSLAAFPWELKGLDDYYARMRGQTDGSTPSAQEQMGWPFFLLGPKVFDPPQISRRDSALLSILAGWWLYAMGSMISEHFITMIYIYGLGYLILVKVLRYCICYRSPLSLWGRICTWRWIIKGYDQVFLAPVGCALVGILVPVGLSMWGVSGVVAQAISLTLALLVWFNIGPSLVAWRLTGNHRIVPILGKSGQLYVKVG